MGQARGELEPAGGAGVEEIEHHHAASAVADLVAAPAALAAVPALGLRPNRLAVGRRTRHDIAVQADVAAETRLLTRKPDGGRGAAEEEVAAPQVLSLPSTGAGTAGTDYTAIFAVSPVGARVSVSPVRHCSHGADDTTGTRTLTVTAPDQAGSRTCTVTATNTAGTATASITVTFAAAPPTVGFSCKQTGFRSDVGLNGNVVTCTAPDGQSVWAKAQRKNGEGSWGSNKLRYSRSGVVVFYFPSTHPAGRFQFASSLAHRGPFDDWLELDVADRRPPPAPAFVSVSCRADGQLAVLWARVADAVQYRLTIGISGYSSTARTVTEYVPETAQPNPPTSHTRVAIAGARYEVTAAATLDGTTWSGETAPATDTCTAVAPPAPTGVTASCSNDVLTVEWDPAGTGLAVATSYKPRIFTGTSMAPDTRWTTNTTGHTNTTATIPATGEPDLPETGTFKVKVKASNTAGDSPYSTATDASCEASCPHSHDDFGCHGCRDYARMRRRGAPRSQSDGAHYWLSGLPSCWRHP